MLPQLATPTVIRPIAHFNFHCKIVARIMHGPKSKMNCLLRLETVLSPKSANEKPEKHHVIGFRSFLLLKVVDLLRRNTGRPVSCTLVKVRAPKYLSVMYVSSLLIK